MKKLSNCRRRKITFSVIGVYMLNIALIISGIFLICKQPHYDVIREMLHKNLEIREGTLGFETWKNISITFRVLLFDVTNPDEVLRGESPHLVERGPYVYDLQIIKQILNIDDKKDEVEFTLTRHYRFNEMESNGHETDEVTILNSAYVGAVTTLVSQFPKLLNQYGDSLQKLFPPPYVFSHGTVKDVLFDGLDLVCNKKKHKDLGLICFSLKASPPPGLQKTEVEGFYKFSLFNKLNGTVQGPFKVNRGIKSKKLLGEITSFKGKQVLDSWHSEDCNSVNGSDTFTWSPLNQSKKRIFTFIPDICRKTFIEYVGREAVNGLPGNRYETTSKVWDLDEAQCYCPRTDKGDLACLPQGLLDVTKCQEVPLVMSEPHFLHADPGLLKYATGLIPNDSHKTFVVFEPFGGVPLVGSKKLQLNMKVSRYPLETLANVSEGFFPILWFEETKKADIEILISFLKTHQILNLVSYILHLPLVFGVFFLVTNLLISGC